MTFYQVHFIKRFGTRLKDPISEKDLISDALITGMHCTTKLSCSVKDQITGSCCNITLANCHLKLPFKISIKLDMALRKSVKRL